MPRRHRSVAISASTSVAATFHAAATATWLSVMPASATTPSSLSVSVNPAGLTAGTYLGSLTLTPALGAAVSIPVSLTVHAAAPLAASSAAVAFIWLQGDPVPAARSIQLTGGGGSASFPIQIPDTTPWLKASPLAGTAPAALSIGVDPAQLAPAPARPLCSKGRRRRGHSDRHHAEVAAPLPAIVKVVNAASYAAGVVAPGEVVTLFGTNLGPGIPARLALDVAESGHCAERLTGPVRRPRSRFPPLAGDPTP